MAASGLVLASAQALVWAAPVDLPAAPSRPGREGVLLIPFLGFHSFQGAYGSSVDTGARLGAVFGYRMSTFWSLNAELAVDVMNPSGPASFDSRGYMADVALAPLFHAPFRRTEL